MKIAILTFVFSLCGVFGFGQALPYNPPPIAGYWNPSGIAWEPMTSMGSGTVSPTNPPPYGLYCLNGSGQWIPANADYLGGSDTGDGTVTDFTAGNLSPLFTTSVATSTTTPALSFTLSNAAQNSVLAGPATGGAGIPSYQNAPTISAANMTNFPSTLVDMTSVQTLTNKTLDGVTPTVMGYVDATSSIQTQLNGKQASLGYTAAHSGANSDITSLSGLTTPLSVAQGGTGTGSTLTGLMRGSVSAMTAAELSGDCTTSGSNATVCTKTNGTAFGTLATSGAGTGVSISGGNLNSNAVYQLSFQPGLLTGVTSTISVFSKVSKASTVDNITGSAFLFSCVSNPTITMYECGTSSTCSGPTTIGTVTVTTAGTATAGTVSSSAVTAGDFVGWALTAGTCTSLDISATAQVHSN